MSYGQKHKAATMLIGMLLLPVCDVVMAAELLKFNPFQPPDMNDEPLHTNASAGVVNEFKLRGTVIDGDASMVNIDGEFYRLNEEVSGYRVAHIESGKVILLRGVNETVLTINDDKQKNKR